MNEIKKILLEAKELVPVVVIENEEDAVPLAQAICDAGGKFIEITLRTKAALGAIEKIKAASVDIIIGAGTILTQDDAKKAIDAGADFLVSPALAKEAIKYAMEQDIVLIPGTITPTEVLKAKLMGLDLLKFFPAEDAGGAKMIKAFGSVYPDIRFMPTGGINQNNIQDYINLPNVGCIGGSWVCTKEDIQQGHFNQVVEKLKTANQLF